MKTFYKVIVTVMVVMLCTVGVASAVSAPTFTATPESGSTVKVGDRVTVVVKTADNYTALNECKYSWNGGTYKSVFDLDGVKSKPGEIWKFTFNSETFYDAGTYVLRMKATDGEGNTSQATFNYVVEEEEEEEKDTEAPTLSANPTSGNIEASETVTITAKDNKGLKSLVYNWNGGSDTTKTISGTSANINITAPKTAGTHKLNITVKDSSNNETKKTFTYTIEELDTQAPTIVATPVTGSTVEAGSRVTVVIEDNGELEGATYSWDDGETKTMPIKSGLYKYTCNLEKFDYVNATYKLYVEARDVAGNVTKKTFTYKVVYDDPTAPVINMSKASGSIVEPGEALTMVVEDEESEVTLLSYKWNSATKVDFIPDYKEPANRCTIKNLKVGTLPGTYTIYITAKNESGKQSEATYKYIVPAVEEPDTEAPTLSANPASGEIAPESLIVLTAKDNEALKTLIYNWDDGTNTTKAISGTISNVNVTAPKTAGKHYLNATVKDASNNETSKTFTYTIVIPDTEKPTVNADPDSGEIAPESLIVLTAKDNEALKTLIYNWDKGSNTTKSISGTRQDVNVTAPKIAGKHYLYVTVIDASDNKVEDYFIYTVKSNEKPTVVVNPNGGEVNPGDDVKITGKDNEGLDEITYNWDDEEPVKKDVSGKEASVPTEVPATPGKHVLHVTVKDEDGNTASKDVEFDVASKDEEKPTVSADPASGEIAPASTIVLTAKDNEALKTLIYNWDKGSDTTKTISGTRQDVNVTAPKTVGKHYLYVTVIDESGNKVNDCFIYVVKDNEKPTIVVNPNGGEVNPGDDVKITGKDNEGLDEITYNWDDEDPVAKNVSGKEASVPTEVPTTPGKHILHVTVEDEDGNTASKDVTFNVVDDEAPTISVNPKSGATVKGGKVVEVTLKDNLQLAKVSYHWGSNKATTKAISGTSKTIDMEAIPSKVGTYKLYVTVEDNAGLVTNGTYTYYVKAEDDDDDGEEPTVDADPDGGEVEYGDRITVTADDDGEIVWVEYYWDDDDDDTTKKYSDEFTVKVPSKEGKHYLYVRAKDDDGNICDYEKFTYYIEENDYPGDSDDPGDINNRVRALRVEIRNADDKIRFEPNEEILYYVDYYNGSSSKVTNAKLVVDLPTYLEADKASDNGKITSTKVTWELGTLSVGQTGRVSFKAHYTSSKVNEKIITVPAKIYAGTSLKDTSSVRNLIYCVGASGTGSHQAYCIGYPDGTFLPEGKITRAELASMISNIEGISSTHRGQFTDANNHWAAKYMQAVVDRGYMIPKTSNYFGAQEYATRGDLMYAIAAILDVEDLEPVFIAASDTQNSNVRCAAEQLLRLGIIDGYSDGSVKPNNNITRAEAVTIIDNYLFRGGLYTKGYNYSYNFEHSYQHGGDSYIVKFTDLSTNHWAYTHIMEATNNHRYERIIDGNENML